MRQLLLCRRVALRFLSSSFASMNKVSREIIRFHFTVSQLHPCTVKTANTLLILHGMSANWRHHQLETNPPNKGNKPWCMLCVVLSLIGTMQMEFLLRASMSFVWVVTSVCGVHGCQTNSTSSIKQHQRATLKHIIVQSILETSSFSDPNFEGTNSRLLNPCQCYNCILKRVVRGQGHEFSLPFPLCSFVVLKHFAALKKCDFLVAFKTCWEIMLVHVVSVSVSKKNE